MDLPREVHESIIEHLLGEDFLVTELEDFKSLTDTSRYWQRLVWKVYWEQYYVDSKSLYSTTRAEKWVQWSKPMQASAFREMQAVGREDKDDIDDVFEDVEAAKLASWVNEL